MQTKEITTKRMSCSARVKTDFENNHYKSHKTNT